MNVRKRWLLAAAIAAGSASMSLAIACSSNDNNNDNNTPEPTAMTTPSETAMTTPSETMADQTPSETMTEGAVHIGEKEYAITGEDTTDIMSPTAGSVTFEVHNNGEVEHSFYVFKTDQDPASLALDGTKVDETKAGTNAGEIESIPKGEVKTLTVNLQPGNYVLICNLPGHYTQGMHTAFVVQ